MQLNILKVNIRFKIYVTVLVIFALDLLAFYGFLNNYGYLRMSIIASIIVGVSIYWIIQSLPGIKLKNLFLLVILPLLFTLSVSYFSKIIFINDDLTINSIRGSLLGIFLIGFKVFGIYTLLLNTNILGISLKQDIPLARAAKSVNYIYSILTLYFIVVSLFSININVHYRLIIFTSVLLLLSYQSLSFLHKINNTKKSQLILLIAFVAANLSVGTMLFQLSPQIFSLSLTILYYVLISIIYDENSKYRLKNLIEYIGSFALILIVVMINIDWGIYKIFN